jgi:hypothetical protein
VDLRFCGDPWIETDPEGEFAVYLGDYRLVTIAGLSIDLPALNTILDRVRHRRPRRWPHSAR